MELCYYNNPNSLFRKYAFVLSYLVKHQVFRDYFTKSGFRLNKKTQLLLPNGFVDYDRGVKRTTVSTRAYNAAKLYPTLQKLDIALPYIIDIWDAQRFVLNDLGLIRKRFDLPQVFLTTTTAYPDPNPETTTVDGNARRQTTSETLAVIRAGAGTAADDTSASPNSTYFRATTTTNEYDLLLRGFFLFDTSSIPDADVISTATFSVYVISHADALGSQGLSLLQTSPASNTAIAASDFEGFTQTVRQATDILNASLTNSAYNDFALNATGITNISLTGITKLGLKPPGDVDNSAPWVSSAVAETQCAFAETAETTSDPKLVVVHSESTSVKDILQMGILPTAR